MSQSSAPSLSAGFFMQQTLIPIKPSENIAHWCPLPDNMSRCPYAKIYTGTNHAMCTSGLNKLPYLMISLISFYCHEMFTVDKTEKKLTWGQGLHFHEPPGTRSPLDCGISAAHKVFLKHEGTSVSLHCCIFLSPRLNG